MIFTFNPKSEILFGRSASEQAGARTRGFGCSKVLCVYDKGVKDAGVVDPIVKNLEAAGLKVVRPGKDQAGTERPGRFYRRSERREGADPGHQDDVEKGGKLFI